MAAATVRPRSSPLTVKPPTQRFVKLPSCAISTQTATVAGAHTTVVGIGFMVISESLTTPIILRLFDSPTSMATEMFNNQQPMFVASHKSPTPYRVVNTSQAQTMAGNFPLPLPGCRICINVRKTRTRGWLYHLPTSGIFLFTKSNDHQMVHGSTQIMPKAQKPNKYPREEARLAKYTAGHHRPRWDADREV